MKNTLKLPTDSLDGATNSSIRVFLVLLCAAVAVEKAATTPEEKSRASANASAPVNVELIFKEPITQEQIDKFAGLGGEITYIYKAVSYGWNGRIPLNKVSAV